MNISDWQNVQLHIPSINLFRALKKPARHSEKLN
jgi:hypothetical protein